MQDINYLINCANDRLSEAESLLLSGHYEWAYYSAGYVIELTLKARIATHLDLPNLFSTEFDDKELAKTFKIHNFVKLAKYGGLYNRISQRELVDQEFRVSWRNVISWTEHTRYLAKGTSNHKNCQEFINNVKIICDWINIQ